MKRRTFLFSVPLAATALYGGHVFAQKAEPVEQLKPGEWAWYPERAQSGPVAVVVSLSDQLAFVYRNGIRIGVSTVSSGKKGFETPVGVFTVLTKEKMHRSHKYNNAAMPDSQFFFGGAALHAGGLPGYPSSHGCVHLPSKFAELVFAVTHHGTPVIVTNERSGVGSLSHTGLVMAESDMKQIEKMTGHASGKSLPVDTGGADNNTLAILVSGADRKIHVLRNGKIFLESPIELAQPRWPVGTHVFVLKGLNPATHNYDWVAIGLGSGHETRIDQQKELAVTTRMIIPPHVYEQIAQNLHPGATMMLTDLPAHPDTRSGEDFVIMRTTPAA